MRIPRINLHRRSTTLTSVTGGRPVSRPLRVASPVAALFLVTLALGASRTEGAPGAYTNDQASRGTAVYTQYCAVCHGANLQGEAGTPLMGRTFLQAYGAGTAAQLYDFLSRQMPLNAPGSLSPSQYLDVTAFILARNGLPPGTAPLSAQSLDQVSLKGMRLAGAGGSSNTDEIVRVAPPTRNVYAQIPAGANVNISDSMMQNAGSDDNNWLLHGRTYDNQRYSPLKQITAENVSSLTPVALVQTGMTASFESTPIVVNGV